MEGAKRRSATTGHELRSRIRTGSFRPSVYLNGSLYARRVRHISDVRVARRGGVDARETGPRLVPRDDPGAVHRTLPSPLPRVATPVALSRRPPRHLER